MPRSGVRNPLIMIRLIRQPLQLLQRCAWVPPTQKIKEISIGYSLPYQYRDIWVPFEASRRARHDGVKGQAGYAVFQWEIRVLCVFFTKKCLKKSRKISRPALNPQKSIKEVGKASTNLITTSPHHLFTSTSIHIIPKSYFDFAQDSKWLDNVIMSYSDYNYARNCYWLLSHSQWVDLPVFSTVVIVFSLFLWCNMSWCHEHPSASHVT